MNANMNIYFDRRTLEQHYAVTEDFRVRSEAWEALARNSISQWYVQQLEDLTFRNLLDVGSGLGRFSQALAKARAVDVTAIDIAEEMVAATRASLAPLAGQHRFLRSSIEEVPFEPASFDLVIANLLLHHVADIPLAFEKLAELARPGGHIALLTADFDWMSELNRWQDYALLKLGYLYDHPMLTAPGTNRFCDANILLFQPSSLELVKRPRFDGTMFFPHVDAVVDFYVRTMRYKNIASQIGDDSLAHAVRELIETEQERHGRLEVSSNLYLYVFKRN